MARPGLLLLLAALVLGAALLVLLDEPTGTDAGIASSASPEGVEAYRGLQGQSLAPIDTEAFEADPVEEAAGIGPSAALEVRRGAAFFAELIASGISLSPESFERLHAQRADRGAMLVGVRDVDGIPVAGALVQLAPLELSQPRNHAGGGVPVVARSAITDLPAAEVLFENLEPGTFGITVVHEAYLTAEQPVIEVAAGRPTWIDIELERASSTISGLVTNESGAPLADASVEAERLVEGAAPTTVATRTKPDGRFTLEVEPDAHYTLIASATGHAESRVPGIVAGASDVTLVLTTQATAEVIGRVVSGAARIPLTSFALDGEAFTSPDGFFAIRRNVAGERPLTLEVAAPAHAARTLTLSVPDEQPVDLGEIVLHGARELNGVVLGIGAEGPQPVEGALVQVTVEGEGPQSMTTSGDGAFSFRGLAAARLRMTIQAAGFEGANREVTLLENEPTFVEVRLVRSPGVSTRAEVTGRITDADTGEPLDGVLVAQVEDPRASARTDAEGRYRVIGVSGERPTLQATHPGYVTATSPVLSGQTPVWNGQLAPRGLRFRFRAGGQIPTVGTEVVLWRRIAPTLEAARTAQANLETHRFTAATDVRGSVAFEVEAGSWFVQVPAYRLHPTPIDHPGEGAPRNELDLPGVTTGEGRLRDAAGSPVANTSIWLHSGDQDYSTMFLYRTDAAGRFTIPNLAPRPYALSIIKNARVQSAQHLVPFLVRGQATQELDVRLPPLEGRIRGHVRDASGQPQAGIQVGVEYLDAPHRSILAGWVTTGTDGSYEVPWLEAGRHRVRTAWTSETCAFSDAITLARGEVRTVDLVVPGTVGRHVSGSMIASDGGPIGGNFVFATDSAGRQNGNFFSTMDWAYVGSFDVGGLASDTWRIDLTAMGHRKTARTVDTRGGDVRGLLVPMIRE